MGTRITIGCEVIGLIRSVARSRADKGMLLEALLDYADNGTAPALPAGIGTLFTMIKRTMDISAKRKSARDSKLHANCMTNCDTNCVDKTENMRHENDKNKSTFGLETTHFVNTNCVDKVEKSVVIADDFCGVARNEIESEKESSPLASPYIEKDKDKDKNTPPNPPVGTATVPVVGDSGKKSCFEFAEFWEAYGKKVDRKKCEVAYARISERSRAVIKAKLPEYISATPDIQFRKNPLTYIHGACWQDEVVVRHTGGSLIGETICGWSEEEVKHGAEIVNDLF